MSFYTIAWHDNTVSMIDQRRLPLDQTYITCSDYTAVAQAIRDMVIRGAPAIGIAGAMGFALAGQQAPKHDRKAFDAFVFAAGEVLVAARPTAVNLRWAVERMKALVQGNHDAPIAIAAVLATEAQRMHDEDIAINRRMGANGAELIADGETLMTYCNTGTLACAGWGTALGVFRSAHEQGKRIHVYVCETRPYLQGARLTAWELMQDGIPCTLITDNMAASIMAKGKIRRIFVGADRIASNGDTANKIGTYSLAVLAKHHGVGMYIVAPTSTFDFDMHNGAEIPIEERAASEVTEFGGRRCAPEGIAVYNPSFDVTPESLITGIVTEQGCLFPPYFPKIQKLASL